MKPGLELELRLRAWLEEHGGLINWREAEKRAGLEKFTIRDMLHKGHLMKKDEAERLAKVLEKVGFRGD